MSFFFSTAKFYYACIHSGFKNINCEIAEDMEDRAEQQLFKQCKKKSFLVYHFLVKCPILPLI